MSKRNHHPRPVEAVKRPEAAEARRLRAAELLAQGRSQAEVAETVGVSRESVRRWQARLVRYRPVDLGAGRPGGRTPYGGAPGAGVGVAAAGRAAWVEPAAARAQGPRTRRGGDRALGGL